MATLQADSIVDLMTVTQKQLGKGKWTDLTSDLQEFIAMDRILKKGSAGVETGQGGTGFQWNIMKTTTGSAAMKGLFATDNYAVSDVMATATLPWRHANANYAIERRELAMNGDMATQIVNLMKIRRFGCMVDLATLFEQQFWGVPSSSSDALNAHGLKYWFVRNATQGFNGGNPSGFSNVAGIDCTDAQYARWMNYTDQYVNITKDDLITRWRRAAEFTKFTPPVSQPSYSSGDKYAYFMPMDTKLSIETILENQNENLGSDIVSMAGKGTFRGVSYQSAPYLNSDTGYPIYGINWGTFEVVFLSGEYMNEAKPRQAPNSEATTVVDIDNSFNFKCTDRRKNFVLYK